MLGSGFFVWVFAVAVICVLVEQMKNVDPSNFDLRRLNIHNGMAYFVLFLFACGAAIMGIVEETTCTLLNLGSCD